MTGRTEIEERIAKLTALCEMLEAFERSRRQRGGAAPSGPAKHREGTDK